MTRFARWTLASDAHRHLGYHFPAALRDSGLVGLGDAVAISNISKNAKDHVGRGCSGIGSDSSIKAIRTVVFPCAHGRICAQDPSERHQSGTREKDHKY